MGVLSFAAGFKGAACAAGILTLAYRWEEQHNRRISEQEEDAAGVLAQRITPLLDQWEKDRERRLKQALLDRRGSSENVVNLCP